MKRCPKCGKTFPDEANFCPTDAGRLVSVADAAPSPAASGSADTGLVGGRFQLGPSLGGSHTGEVHRAVDSQGGATVAVKLVAPEVVAIPQVAQRIERELKQLERVSHKAVARVIASGKHGDRVFIATEIVDGARPLSELVAASGPLDPQRASDLILAIGEGLIEAAKVGVVHRDLSPKNILVTQNDLKLINFCVPAPSTEKAPGVPEFVAPESVEGKPVDQRSNIYSLAAIHYFLLTGRAPHIGDPATVLAAHLSGTVEPPSKHAAVPADVDALVVRALERNAAKRYLTLRQFLDEVERVARGPEGGTGSTAPFGRAGKTKELASTLMGFGFGGMPSTEAAQEARTKQMDVAIPPEALRDAAALDAAVAAAQAPEQPAAAPAQAAVVTHDMPAIPPGATADVGSPWAPPRDAFAPPQAAPAMGAAATVPAGNDAFAQAAVAMQQAAPAMGAAASAAGPSSPVMAAPKVGGAPAGKKKGEEKEKKKDAKGKFRETMWFKKGELDAAAAEEAAATGDVNATGKADLMPIEERYSDDGSINASDAQKYSLKTGATSMMKAVGNDDASPSASVSERELVGEMKGGRNLIVGVIIASVISLSVAIYFLML